MFFKEKYKNYVMYGGLNKMDKLKKALPFIIPPLAVLLIMGFAFYRHGLYPFGDGTVSWCDMSQQVIPLLTDFKDIFNSMTKDDYVIICGDFGLVWNNDKEDMWWRSWLNDRPFTTLFVDGNHENFDLLNAYPVENWHGGKIHRIAPSIIHLMRGQLFDIEGKSFFTMGGAESHDREFRTIGISIWEQELPNNKEYAQALSTLEKCEYKADYVITHCAPTDIEYEVEHGKCTSAYNFYYSENRLTEFFRDLAEKMQYERWFCGHYHCDYVSKLNPKFEILYDKIVTLP